MSFILAFTEDLLTFLDLQVYLLSWDLLVFLSNVVLFSSVYFIFAVCFTSAPTACTDSKEAVRPETTMMGSADTRPEV